MEGVSVREIFTQLPASVQRQLNQLATVFSDENQKLNLSAHRTHEKIWQGNVMDTMAAFKWIASLCPSILQPPSLSSRPPSTRESPLSPTHPPRRPLHPPAPSARESPLSPTLPPRGE